MAAIDVRAYAELVRIYLTPTAPADSWTGFFLAFALRSGAVALDRRTGILLAGLAVMSIAAYWVGMITNDLFDRAKDRDSFPSRPLASGTISRSYIRT